MNDIASGLVAAAGAVTRPIDRDALFGVIKDIAKARGSGLTQAEVDRINGVLDGALAGESPPRFGAVPRPGGLRIGKVLEHVVGRAEDANIRAVADAITEHAPRYGQDATPERMAEFIAQIANETGGFAHFSENLNYSAKRLTEVWPGRYPTLAAAQPYARNPEALATHTYGGRMGNTQAGDGWRFRGRGALQLTGRANYERFGQLLGLDLVGNPDLAADPAVSVLIALEFFKQGRVNVAIDRGDFRQARKITNGGYIGVEEVARLRAKALQVLR